MSYNVYIEQYQYYKECIQHMFSAICNDGIFSSQPIYHHLSVSNKHSKYLNKQKRNTACAF